MDNHELIVKTALASADLSAGGYLNTMQSEKFLRGVIDQPTLLKSCRTVFIDGESKKIEKIGFGSRIMRPADENTALTSDQYSKPTFGKVELLTKEVIAEVRISYDTLENNIEGQQLKSTIMSMIQERVALDLEELMIQGDTDSADPYLAVTNGILKKCNIHSINAANNGVNLETYKKLIGAVPSKYRRVIPQWRIYTSHDVDMDWKEQIAARNTVAGDRFLLQNVNATAMGYEIQPCAMIPVSGAGISTALLTHPQNLIAGFTRKVQIETDKDISARQIIIVVTVKVDFAIEEADACAKIINIQSNPVASAVPATLGTKGISYHEVVEAFTADDTINIYGTTYTCKAAAAPLSNEFAGATIAEQVESLASMAEYGGFVINADNDRLVFTQVAPVTDFLPVLVEVGAGNTTGEISALILTTVAVSPTA